MTDAQQKTTLACAKVADVISMMSDQRARVIDELVKWIVHPGSGTWDCEAAGLRLRAGKSLQNWCTADFRGKLLAVSCNTKGNPRETLVLRLAEVAATCYGRPLAWHDLRAENVYASAHSFELVSLASDGKSHAVVRENSWMDVFARRAQAGAKWHLRRTGVVLDLPYVQMHACGSAAAALTRVLYEAGSGPVAFGMDDVDAVRIVVTPPPTATTQAINRMASTAVSTYRARTLGGGVKRKRVVLNVVKFEDVT